MKNMTIKPISEMLKSLDVLKEKFENTPTPTPLTAPKI